MYRTLIFHKCTHNKLNADLGLPKDPATVELFKFIGPFVETKPSIGIRLVCAAIAAVSCHCRPAIAGKPDERQVTPS
jgi:hypothetical protein